ncbi:glycerate kinase [Planctomycetales bacterium ZRK34]|nr:glycerate kinase [Planctomycetales bacterium ZRK34]
MKILVAPDSFKESMTAAEAAAAIGRGITAVLPQAQIDLCPVADGGEGTVDALVHATGGRVCTTCVMGPLGIDVQAKWGLLGDGETAVIEMAEAAGLHLAPADQRDPTRTTTYGVGQLIAAALDAGARRIILGIGGSATTDGGTGMAQALGVQFEGGSTPMTGGALGDVTAIDLAGRDPRLGEVEIVVACDVTNPLTGPRGAAAVYGPQKGATAEQVLTLDAGLAHLATLVDYVDATLPGAGAAGGLGFGLVAFADARLERGINLVLEAVDFDTRVRDAALVITGEGRLDGQSIQGKTCLGVAQAAQKHGVKTIALVGCLGADVEQTLAHGLTTYHSLVEDGTSPERAMREGPALLEALAQRVVPDYL